MKRTGIKEVLEVATNACVLLLAVFVLGSFAWGYYKGHQQRYEVQVGLRKGQRLPALFGVTGDSPKALVIAMNTRCSICTESIPFYNQLADLQRQSGNKFRIVAIFPNSEPEVNNYIAAKQLTVEFHAAVDFNQLGLSGTPTLLLIDKSGNLVDFWLGKQTNDNEKQIIHELS